MNDVHGTRFKTFGSKVMSGTLSLAVTAMLIGGCASGAKVAPKPADADTFKGPFVDKLADGRQGFVIHEDPGMDAQSRELFDRAVTCLNDGKNDKAIELFSKVIDRKPLVTAPHINIAVAYMRVGNAEKAEGHLKAALAIVPGHPVASNEYGLLLRKEGRFKEAREVYEKSAAQYPEYLPVHRNLGILCDLYMGDPECALHEFEIYAAGVPRDKQVGVWIAELKIRLKR